MLLIVLYLCSAVILGADDTDTEGDPLSFRANNLSYSGVQSKALILEDEAEITNKDYNLYAGKIEISNNYQLLKASSAVELQNKLENFTLKASWLTINRALDPDSIEAGNVLFSSKPDEIVVTALNFITLSNESYLFSGNVIIEDKINQFIAQADRFYYHRSGLLELVGRAEIMEETRLVKAQLITINIKTGQMNFTNVEKSALGELEDAISRTESE